ncbi:MAG: lipid II flippase MurJ [Candidatus Dojkabacteria bacterium]|nr:lipid II flippase MurJ [Candidatus Dojkabacteria bacterium]
MEKEKLKKNGVFFIMLILFITKIFGFLKLRTIAQLFGASHELDIFWAAFTIPDMLFMILVAGSINAAIIPIFSDIFYKKGKEKLDKFFNYLLIILSIIIIFFALILFIFTPQITNFIIQSETLQGFLNFSQRITDTDFKLFVDLTRIMLLSPILLSISSLITAYLHIQKEFFTTSLAPLFYNIAMTIGPVITVALLKMGVDGIAISAVIGSVLHLVIQIPKFLSHYKSKFILSFRSVKEAFVDTHTWRAIKLAIPRTIGIIGEQINVVVNTLISFSLAAGALSAYKFAISLHLFPINIIGSAVAQVTLPDLAQHNSNRRKFIEILNKSIQFSLYLIFPIVAILIVLRLPIVRLAYGSGAFDWRATILTAWCLILLALSIVGQTVVQIILRAFYALKETWLPLIAIVIGILLNIFLAYYLTNFFSHYYDWRPILDRIFEQISTANGDGLWPVIKSFFKDIIVWSTNRGTSDFAVGGLSLSLGITYFVEMIIMMLLLNVKGKIITWKETIKPTLIKVLNTLIMGVGMYFVFKLFDFHLDTTRTFSIIVIFVVVSIYGLISYWLGSKIFRINEIESFEKKMVDLFNKFFRRKKDAESL